MAQPQPPQMQIGEGIAIILDRLPHTVRHAPVRVHVEENGPGVADQAIGPAYNNKSPDYPGKRVDQQQRTGMLKARTLIRSDLLLWPDYYGCQITTVEQWERWLRSLFGRQ